MMRCKVDCTVPRPSLLVVDPFCSVRWRRRRRPKSRKPVGRLRNDSSCGRCFKAASRPGHPAEAGGHGGFPHGARSVVRRSPIRPRRGPRTPPPPRRPLITAAVPERPVHAPMKACRLAGDGLSRSPGVAYQGRCEDSSGVLGPVRMRPPRRHHCRCRGLGRPIDVATNRLRGLAAAVSIRLGRHFERTSSLLPRFGLDASTSRSRFSAAA